MKILLNYKRTTYPILLMIVLLTSNRLSLTASNQTSIGSALDSTFYTSFVTDAALDINYITNNYLLTKDEFLPENSRLAKKSSKLDNKMIFYEEIENELSLEDWMLSSNHQFWDDLFREDMEEEIVIENWMIDSSKW